MFESDDFDQILSQFDFPEENNVCKVDKSNNAKSSKSIEPVCKLNDTISLFETSVDYSNKSSVKDYGQKCLKEELHSDITSKNVLSNSKGSKINSQISPKHTKRKIIDTHFDQKSKRKFPGPAGLLAGSLKDNNDEYVSQMELLSQDVDYTHNCLQKDIFHSPLWCRLLEDVKEWNLGSIDTMKIIKQCSLQGSLKRRKAQTVVAVIESIDRSIIDPLITLRDSTGFIKCTLHRDAWSIFSSYLMSDICALILWKPTILTTGSAFKKYYLNITLSNIFALYSSTVLNEKANIELPKGYTKIYEEDYTVISTDMTVLRSGLNTVIEPITDTNGLCDGLDSIFSDEMF